MSILKQGLRIKQKALASILKSLIKMFILKTTVFFSALFAPPEGQATKRFEKYLWFLQVAHYPKVAGKIMLNIKLIFYLVRFLRLWCMQRGKKYKNLKLCKVFNEQSLKKFFFL
jgi:hypothetical protein